MTVHAVADAAAPAGAAEPPGPPLLVARGICKSFGAVQALADVDFEVARGQVVALVGDNGAGKSTLIKAIAGVQLADAGHFLFDGAEVHIHSPQQASALGIATVYQDLALCDNLDVVANLHLGSERVERGFMHRFIRTIDELDMEVRTKELLRALSITTLQDVRAETATLSGGQRQAVAIARALIGDPRLVILDEPTAALGVVQTAQVLELIHHLRERGLGVVVISHNLDTVFDVSDVVVVLRLGRRVATFDATTASRADVVSAMVGGGVPKESLA